MSGVSSGEDPSELAKFRVDSQEVEEEEGFNALANLSVDEALSPRSSTGKPHRSHVAAERALTSPLLSVSSGPSRSTFFSHRHRKPISQSIDSGDNDNGFIESDRKSSGLAHALRSMSSVSSALGFGTSKSSASSNSNKPVFQSRAHIKYVGRAAKHFWSSMKDSMTGKREVIKQGGQVKEYVDDDVRQECALHRKWLLHPQKRWKMVWDMLFVSAILISTSYIPYYLAFMEGTEEYTDVLVESAFTVLFCTDIFVEFNTATLDEVTGALITSRTAIALSYLRFWFWIDLLSSFPFDIILITLTGNASLVVLRLFRLLRFFKLFSLTRITRHVEQLHRVSILAVFFQLLFVAHAISCFWYYYGNTSKYKNPDTSADFPNTWVDAFIPTSYGTYDKYVASIYWTLFTMLGIGYGDIHAVNSGERTFTVWVGVVGSVFLGVLLAQVSSFIRAANLKTIVWDEKMKEFISYVNTSSKMSSELKKKSIDAYSYFLDRRADVDVAGSLNGIPSLLLNNLIVSLYGSSIKRIKLLSSVDMEKSFVVSFIVNGRPFEALRNELLFKQGDIADELTFVIRGSVIKYNVKEFDAVEFMRGNDNCAPSLNKVVEGYATHGYYFGDFELFGGTTRGANYSAFVKSEFISISYTKFKKLLELFPKIGKAFFAAVKSRQEVFAVTSASSLVPISDCIYSHVSIWVDGESRVWTCVDSADLFRQTSDTHCIVLAIDVDSSGGEVLFSVEETSAMLRKRLLIFPTCPEKIAWDFLIFILLLYIAFCVTTQVAFERDSIGPWLAVDWLIMSAYFIDIVLSFLTVVKHPEHNEWVGIHSAIASSYLRSWFFIDLLSALPFEYFISNNEVSFARMIKFFRIIKLIRVIRLFKIQTLVEVFASKFRFSPGVVKGFYLALLVTFVGHFVTCLWWYVCINMSDSESWIDNASAVYNIDLRRASLREQYTVASYWTFVTLLGIGYGDIVAMNTGERLLNTIIMIAGSSLLLNYILASVAMIVHEVMVSGARIGQLLLSTRIFLMEKNVPANLRESILSFVKVRCEIKTIANERALLSDLPVHIREEVSFVQNIDVLKMIPLFIYISNRSVIIHLYNLLHVTYYDKSEYVFFQGETIRSMKFLVAGYAMLFTKKPAPANRRASTTVTQKAVKRVALRDHQSERVLNHFGKLNTTEVSLAADVTKIETVSPDPADYYFVKKVVPGDIFDSVIPNGKQGEVFTAWTRAQSCVYSLSNEAIEKFILDFPALEGVLRDAFIGVFRSQGRRAKMDVWKKKLRRMSAEVRDLNYARVRANQNPIEVFVSNIRAAIAVSDTRSKSRSPSVRSALYDASPHVDEQTFSGGSGRMSGSGSHPIEVNERVGEGNGQRRASVDTDSGSVWSRFWESTWHNEAHHRLESVESNYDQAQLVTAKDIFEKDSSIRPLSRRESSIDLMHVHGFVKVHTRKRSASFPSFSFASSLEAKSKHISDKLREWDKHSYLGKTFPY